MHILYADDMVLHNRFKRRYRYNCGAVCRVVNNNGGAEPQIFTQKHSARHAAAHRIARICFYVRTVHINHGAGKVFCARRGVPLAHGGSGGGIILSSFGRG